MRWIDAHNHLQDTRLAPWRAELMAELERNGTVAAIVNGTREDDWDAVAALAAERPWIRPAFGLHPWFVAGRSAQWRERLVALLEAHPHASLGEIGLDRWVQGYDWAAQREVFAAQLALARERNLPATVHCLQAWGALEEMTREGAPPACGWLLHSFSGSREMMEEFTRRGAYFSFSGYFLHERKAAAREVFRLVPLERLLVETDAPDMLPPERSGARFLRGDSGPEPLNSPTYLELCYRGLAELRELPVEDLAAQVEENFQRLFGATSLG